MKAKIVKEILNEVLEEKFNRAEFLEYLRLKYPAGNLSNLGEKRYEKLKKKYGFINPDSKSKTPKEQFEEKMKNNESLIDNTEFKVPRSVIFQILKYCEDKQIYDKLGPYQDFYYKLKQIINEPHNFPDRS